MTLSLPANRLSPVARRLVAMKFLTYVGLLSSYFIGILGTLTYSLGGDALSTTFAVGLLNASMAVGSMSGGALLDAVGPRRHFVVYVAATCVAALLFQVLSAGVFGVLLGAVVFGFSMGMGEPVARSYPAYLTDDPEELKRINAALSVAVNVGVIAGPLVGSAIASVAPTQTVLLFAALTALAGLVPAAGFHPPRSPGVGSEDGRAESAGGLAVGFGTVFTSPALRMLLAVGFLTFFGYGAFDPLESLFYRDVLQVGVEWMGWLSSASGVGAIAGAALVARIPSELVNLRTLLWALFGMGASCLLYVGTPYVGVALAGQVLLGVAFGVINPLEHTLVQTHAPLESVGRVSAVMSFGYSFAGVVPLLLAPWLAGVLGVQGTLVAASVCVSVFPLACLVALRRRLGR